MSSSMTPPPTMHHHTSLRILSQNLYGAEEHNPHQRAHAFASFLEALLPDTRLVFRPADALRLAFPDASELIVDSEVVMRAPDGAVLPFGAQGVHEQKKHKDATCCLVVFDLLALDGGALTSEPLQRRRRLPTRVNF